MPRRLVLDYRLMSGHGPSSCSKLQSLGRIVTPLWTGILLVGCLLGAGNARGQAFLPPRGQIFAGVAGQPISTYQRAVGKHPAVYQVFSAWGEYLPGIFRDAESAHARLMIHITTASGTTEMITPGAIARGEGDAWLIALGQAAYDSGVVTYVRLMAEMNGYWNFYSAFGASGRRDADHSTAAYRRAWRRVTLILRGGSRTAIDAQLRILHMPPLRTSHDLPHPRMAMLWVPQSSGSPDVPGNQPRDYWPGRAWVDWVGTDFYSRFPNFSGLDSLYDAYPHEPFVFGEYALWGGDDPGWVRELFAWVRSHPRVRMLIYNQGLELSGPFRLARYPRSAHAMRDELASRRYPAFAPEWAP
jgi:hypothetical protein